MGLDIDLIRIVKRPTGDLTFLPEDENPELEEQFGHLKNSRSVDYGQGIEISSGYYFEELAYQRKGVIREFYSRYNPDEFLFTRKELDELITYVDEAHQKSFKTDFVGKFVEGDTIVWMGY
jgi:hypothetical protein